VRAAQPCGRAARSTAIFYRSPVVLAKAYDGFGSGLKPASGGSPPAKLLTQSALRSARIGHVDHPGPGGTPNLEVDATAGGRLPRDRRRLVLALSATSGFSAGKNVLHFERQPSRIPDLAGGPSADGRGGRACRTFPPRGGSARSRCSSGSRP
jgi:hypothetical protein